MNWSCTRNLTDCCAQNQGDNSICIMVIRYVHVRTLQKDKIMKCYSFHVDIFFSV